jgi:hypothetical protein
MTICIRLPQDEDYVPWVTNLSYIIEHAETGDTLGFISTTINGERWYAGHADMTQGAICDPDADLDRLIHTIAAAFPDLIDEQEPES